MVPGGVGGRQSTITWGHKAAELKKVYNKAIAAVTGIMESIETDENWGWAKNEENKDKIHAKMVSAKKH